MADIIYTYQNSVYFNITNKCPCRCVFCIRDKVEAIGEAENLFHESEPTLEEILSAVDAYDFGGKDTAVFCGYGEPTNAFQNLISTAEYLKEKYPSLKLRLNTNGLSDLINERETAKEICKVFDSVSISLNDVSSEEYDKITRNIYPGKAYEAMLKFTKDCVNEGIETRLSVVDVIGEEKAKKAKEIAESIGATFLCRKYDR